MDVTCERCSTRYEFDAALVSTRGTTVKCTTCGHQFKIYRKGGSPADDGWTVRTVDGRMLRFSAMRELQRAIAHGDVTTEDVLVPHDGGEPRRLGRIDELQSFFSSSDDVTNIRRASHLPPAPGKRARITKANPPNRTPPSSRRTNVMRPAPPAADSRPERPTMPRMRRVDIGASASGGTLTDRDGNPLPVRSGTTRRPPRHDSGPIAIPSAPPLPNLATPQAAPQDAPTSQMPGKRTPTLAPPAPTAAPRPHRQPAAGRSPVATKDREAPEILPRSEATLDDSALDEQSTLPNAASERDAALQAYAHAQDKSPARTTPAATKRRLAKNVATPATSESPHADEPSDPAIASPISFDSESVPSVSRPSILHRRDERGPRLSDYPQTARGPGWARWGVGLLVLGLLGVGGFALMKRLRSDVAPTSVVSSSGNEKVNQFLKNGEERLAAGDLEGAKEQYNKASGIDEKDPRVAGALATVELIRADIAWLQLRLLTDDAPQRNSAALKLRRTTDRAATMLDQLAEGGEKSAALVGMRMDLLRMRGKPAEARKLATQLDSSNTDSGRVLAVLDLSESDPTFDNIFERLRTAARGERKLGRAQSALIYALAVAGKRDEAERELSNLRSQNEHHELLIALTAFVDKMETSLTPDTSAKATTPDPTNVHAIPRDFRAALRAAHEARSRGDLDRAEQLYNIALDSDPGNTEAMAGLADVARDRGDSDSASKRYENMLKDNPSYIPGLIGLADVKWASGDKAGAVKLYQQVAQSAPGSSYASRANSRINQYQSEQAAAPPPPPPPPAESASSSAPPPPPPVPSPAPPPPPPPSDTPPGVDTSDLPGF